MMTEVGVKLLDAVLDGTQVPHQPLLVIADSPLVPGLALLREVLRRSERSGLKNVLVTALHPAESLLQPGSSCSTIDLTGTVPGFTDSDSDTSLKQLNARISAAYSGSGSIFVDALDVLAEDHSPSAALRFFRSLLSRVREAKAPARLVLLLPSQSPFLASITPPTISPTITLLTPHPPQLLGYLSKAYLVPIEASGRYWQILETASSRRLAEDLSLKGELDSEPSTSKRDTVVQVVVRKATGGTKGMSRSLEALTCSSSAGAGGWVVKPVSAIMDISPISAVPTTATQPAGSASGAAGAPPPKTHADLDLPFNLHLTDQQKAARMGVPLPYAHEGEGAAVDLEFDDEEDEDDEEI